MQLGDLNFKSRIIYAIRDLNFKSRIIYASKGIFLVQDNANVCILGIIYAFL